MKILSKNSFGTVAWFLSLALLVSFTNYKNEQKLKAAEKESLRKQGQIQRELDWKERKVADLRLSLTKRTLYRTMKDRVSEGLPQERIVRDNLIAFQIVENGEPSKRLFVLEMHSGKMRYLEYYLDLCPSLKWSQGEVVDPELTLEHLRREGVDHKVHGAFHDESYMESFSARFQEKDTIDHDSIYIDLKSHGWVEKMGISVPRESK